MKLFFKSRAKKHSAFSNGFGPKTESEVTLSISEEISFENDKVSEDEFFSTFSLEKEKCLSTDLNSSFKNGDDVSESDDDSFKSLNEKLKVTKYCVKKTPTLTPVQTVKEPKKKWTEKIKKKFQKKKKFSNKEKEEHKECSPNFLDVNSTPQPLSVNSTPQQLSGSICNESPVEDQSTFFKSDWINEQEMIISDATLLNDTVNDDTGCTENCIANDSITWLKNESTFDLTWENKKPPKSWEIKKPSKLNLANEQPVQPIGLILYDDDVPKLSIKTLLNEKELKQKRQRELEYIDQEALNRDGIFVSKLSCQDLTFFPPTSNHLQSTSNEINLLSCSKKCSNESLQSKKITIPKANLNVTFCKPNVTNNNKTSLLESISWEKNECRQNQKFELTSKYNYSGHSSQPISVNDNDTPNFILKQDVSRQQRKLAFVDADFPEKEKEIFRCETSNHVEASNQIPTLFSPNLPPSIKNKTLTQPNAKETSNCNTNKHSQSVENKCSNISKHDRLKESRNKKKVSFVESQQNLETSTPEVINSSVLFCTPSTPSENKSLPESTSLIETKSRRKAFEIKPTSNCNNNPGQNSTQQLNNTTKHLTEFLPDKSISRQDKVSRQQRKLAFVDAGLQQREEVIHEVSNLVEKSCQSLILSPTKPPPSTKPPASTKDPILGPLYAKDANNFISKKATSLMENEFKPYASLDYLKNVVGAKTLQKNINNMDKSSLFSAYNLGKNIENEDSPNFNVKDDLVSLVNDKKRVADEIMQLKSKTADLKKVAKERTADLKRIKKQEAAKRQLEKKEAKKCEKVKKKNAKARTKLEMEIAKYVEEKLKADNKEDDPELWEISKYCDNQFKKSNDVQSNYNASDELLEKITDELINRLSFNQLKNEYKLLKTSLKDVHEKKITNIQAIYTLQKKTIEYEQAFREFRHKIQLLIKKHGYKEELFEIKKNKEIKKMKIRQENEKNKLSIDEFNVLNQSDPPSESRKNWLNSILKKISVKDFGMKQQNLIKIKDLRKNKHLKAAKQEIFEYNDGEHIFKSISDSPLYSLSKRLKDARTSATFKLFQTIENHGFIFPEKKISKVKKYSHKRRKPVISHFQNSTLRRKKKFQNYNTLLNATQQKSRENKQNKKKKQTRKKIISKLIYDLESEKIRRKNAEKKTVQLKKKCKKYHTKAVAAKQELINEQKKLKLYKEEVDKKVFNAQNQSKKSLIETPNYMSMAFDTIDKYIGKS